MWSNSHCLSLNTGNENVGDFYPGAIIAPEVSRNGQDVVIYAEFLSALNLSERGTHLQLIEESASYDPSRL